MHDDIVKRAQRALESLRHPQKTEDDRGAFLTTLNQLQAGFEALLAEVRQLATRSPQVTVEPTPVTVQAPDVNVTVPEVKVPTPTVTVKLPKKDDAAIIHGLKSLEQAVSSQKITFPDQIEYTTQRPMPIEIIADRVGLNQGQKTAYLRGKGGNVASVRDFTSSIAAVDMAIVDASGNQITSFGGGTQYTEGDVDTSFTGTFMLFEGNDDNAKAVSSTAAFPVNVVDAFGSTAAGGVFNADNRLRVSVETGGSGLTDAELRATSVPVAQVSGASWSTEATQAGTWNIGTVTTVTGVTNALETKQVSGFTDSVHVVDIFGSAAASSVFNADNRVRVSVETGGSGLTDAELRAASVPVMQVSGFTDSVNVVGFTASVAVSLQTDDGDSAMHEGANAAKAILVAADGTNYDAKGWNISLPITPIEPETNIQLVNDFGAFVIGAQSQTNADSGSNRPVKVGGVGRTTNPTAVANDQITRFISDDLGRQLIRPIQVRDLTVTARATLTNGTETTLLAAAAGSFHDLIYVMGANVSDAATTVDIRAVTAGNVMLTLQLPANGTSGVALPVPLPQDAMGNNWTADMGDITGTTVYLSGLFSREV